MDAVIQLYDIEFETGFCLLGNHAFDPLVSLCHHDLGSWFKHIFSPQAYIAQVLFPVKASQAQGFSHLTIDCPFIIFPAQEAGVCPKGAYPDDCVGRKGTRMIDISTIDYSKFDRPEILTTLFHPRPEWPISEGGGGSKDILIPVGKDVVVGGRFHLSGKSNPNILFFHGNGEIVADYDDLGGLYVRSGMNFLPVDYRGYGRSTGTPTITNMMRDAHVIFDHVLRWLSEKGHGGPLIAMGRSLGSASALELSAHYGNRIDGLAIESGFAYAGPLLRLLGIDMEVLGLREEEGFSNLEKIRRFAKPTLIIHAEQDHIIPFSEGQALYEASPARGKRLLRIPGANHNDIFLRGMAEYMGALKALSIDVSG